MASNTPDILNSLVATLQILARPDSTVRLVLPPRQAGQRLQRSLWICETATRLLCRACALSLQLRLDLDDPPTARWRTCSLTSGRDDVDSPRYIDICLYVVICTPGVRRSADSGVDFSKSLGFTLRSVSVSRKPRTVSPSVPYKFIVKVSSYFVLPSSRYHPKYALQYSIFSKLYLGD